MPFVAACASAASFVDATTLPVVGTRAFPVKVSCVGFEVRFSVAPLILLSFVSSALPLRRAFPVKMPSDVAVDVHFSIAALDIDMLPFVASAVPNGVAFPVLTTSSFPLIVIASSH